MNRIRMWTIVMAAAAMTLSVAQTTLAREAGRSVTVAQADLKWADTGIPGVTMAVVRGDAKKGPSHFFLKYPAGFVTPLHHHSPDHYVTTVSGNLVLIVGGKENALPAGSYFALTGKAPHVARCDGSEDCVMFLDARGPWDVVPDKEPAPAAK